MAAVAVGALSQTRATGAGLGDSGWAPPPACIPSSASSHGKPQGSTEVEGPSAADGAEGGTAAASGVGGAARPEGRRRPPDAAGAGEALHLASAAAAAAGDGSACRREADLHLLEALDGVNAATAADSGGAAGMPAGLAGGGASLLVRGRCGGGPGRSCCRRSWRDAMREARCSRAFTWGRGRAGADEHCGGELGPWGGQWGGKANE